MLWSMVVPNESKLVLWKTAEYFVQVDVVKKGFQHMELMTGQSFWQNMLPLNFSKCSIHRVVSSPFP